MRSFGTIERRKTHWRARYTAPDGGRYHHNFETKAEARFWLDEQHRLITTGTWQPPTTITPIAPTLTVGEWLHQWLELHALDVKPSTAQNYRAVIGRRILPHPLADIPLADLTKKDIAGWWDDNLRANGRTADLTGAYLCLKQALAAAVSRDMIPDNPATLTGVSAPRPARKQLPEYETMMAVTLALAERYRLVAVLTFFHGLRLGEALALRRCDIVAGNNGWVVQVRGTVYRERTNFQTVRLDTPKTEAGIRDVPVFAKFAPYVERHLEEFAPAGADDRIFTTSRGTPLSDPVYRMALARAKKTAGVTDRLTPHYGRVWLITTLAEAGMPIPAIGRILGQRDLKTITEVYMRASEERVTEVLSQVDERLTDPLSGG